MVESITDDGFSARLTAARNGQVPDPGVEFTDFSWAEITAADRDLVKRDAVFYWTIARSSNEAGTSRNESLVRFRRTPRLTNYHTHLAATEAQELLKDLGAGSESN